MSGRYLRIIALSCLATTFWLAPAIVRADKFVYRDQQNKSVEVEARLAGSGQGVMILECDDGQYRLVPEAAIVKREVGEGPVPLTHEEMAARLQERFGADFFRSYVREPFVLGLVLSSPLPKSSESRARAFLGKVATFMKKARIPAKVPMFPLVVLIFETEEAFEKYTKEETGERGLSASRIAGFYSGVTNFLAIRLGECRTLEVPLHEAIHQQVYNRNVFQRLSPVPHWFDEGIATGFEANEGRINIGPTKVSPMYARQALAAQLIDWELMMTKDGVFAGDIIAGEAYGHAWGLHWLLVTKYRSQYGKYVRLLAEKEPLMKEEPEQRLADFQEAFGKSVGEMEKEFLGALETAIKRQKVELVKVKPAGISLTKENVGEVELTAVSFGSRIDLQGKLMNVSPFRPMAFYVVAVTDGGTYADWHIPNLDVMKTAQLPVKNPTQLIRGVTARGASERFRVKIISAPPDSDEAARWKKGELPVPQVGQ
jgi:hypothetical protein